MNGFSVVDEKLTRKRIKGDGEEILPAVSVRCPFPSYLTHTTLESKVAVKVHPFYILTVQVTLVLEIGKVFTSFGLGWNLWGMNLEETF